MKAYFFSTDGRYVGNRELLENEELPGNATEIPVVVGDYEEAFLVDGVWEIRKIVEPEPKVMEPQIEEAPTGE